MPVSLIRQQCTWTKQIHEVYYDDEGRIKFYTEKSVAAFGDDKEELYEDFAKMWKAFDEEPLDLDRVDKKLFIRMINEEFKDVYDKHMQRRDDEKGVPPDK
jgi:hypothetical protein